jgi:hypothetical protein
VSRDYEPRIEKEPLTEPDDEREPTPDEELESARLQWLDDEGYFRPPYQLILCEVFGHENCPKIDSLNVGPHEIGLISCSCGCRGQHAKGEA